MFAQKKIRVCVSMFVLRNQNQKKKTYYINVFNVNMLHQNNNLVPVNVSASENENNISVDKLM